MVLYGPDGKGANGYLFFTSTNLLAWKVESFLPGWYECPDMFKLVVDGNPNQTKWVLLNGDGAYRIGVFDGLKFTPETALRRIDWGGNFYGTQKHRDD